MMTPVAAAPVRTATLPMLPTPGQQAGSTEALGGIKVQFDVKRMLLFGAVGAVAGLLVPVIPGGPIGGALIGAGLAMVL